MVDKYFIYDELIKFGSNDKENLLKKVYWVEDECLANILEGVAEYKYGIYFFNNILFEVNNSWTNEYNLILLNKEIFDLKLWNFNYLNQWHSQSSNIHYWEDYELERDETSFKEMERRYGKSEFLVKAEKYYLNDKIIKTYLHNNDRNFILKGKFFVNDIEYNINEMWYKDINEYNIVVKWEI